MDPNNDVDDFLHASELPIMNTDFLEVPPGIPTLEDYIRAEIQRETKKVTPKVKAENITEPVLDIESHSDPEEDKTPEDGIKTTIESQNKNEEKIIKKEEAPKEPQYIRTVRIDRMDDDDSVCDWTPPPEVPIVESEVFQIPSGLPSFDTFMRNELQKEQEAADRQAIIDNTIQPELDTETPKEDNLPEKKPDPENDPKNTPPPRDTIKDKK